MARASPLLLVRAHRYSQGQNRQTSRFESRASHARFDPTHLITLKSKAPDSSAPEPLHFFTDEFPPEPASAETGAVCAYR